MYIWKSMVFTYFWPLYFLVTMNEHPPADPWDINMVEGCHIGWYGQIVQAEIIWKLTMKVFKDEVPGEPLELMAFVKEWSFALMTPLEYLYPQLAFCEAAPYQLKDMFDSILILIIYDKIQILYNIFRKFGTISYSFMTFWGCFRALDGKCAGIRSGRFLYYIFDFKNFFQIENLD